MRALVVVTDERPEYLEDTLKSAEERLKGGFGFRLIMDDSGNPEFAEYLRETYPGYMVNSSGVTMGRCHTMAHAWAIVRRQSAEFVFHLQNDFTFNRDVDLDQIQGFLVRHPELAQVAFMRQPWSEAERLAGSVYKKDPVGLYKNVEEGEDKWVEHMVRFTDNPSLIPIRVLGLPSTTVDYGGEAVFSQSVKAAGYKCAYWGTTEDPPWVEHIGLLRMEQLRATRGRFKFRRIE